MAGTSAPQAPESQYSSVFAFAYIFNLVIGVGALALPLAFSQAGLVLGTLLIVTLAFMSFVTSSYIIEAMAAANAYGVFKEREKWDEQRLHQQTHIQSDESLSESTPLLQAPLVINEDPPSAIGDVDEYEITKKYELGTMANMFFHPVGIVLYYLCICVYLYGDLAIYAVSIPKSMRTVLCSEHNVTHEAMYINLTNLTNSSLLNYDYYTDGFDYENDHTENKMSEIQHLCFGSRHISGEHTYYICLAVTAILLCPWTFFNLTRSKYLQLFTTILRNVAFTLMIVLTIVDMIGGHRAHPKPPSARFEGFPVLFGVSIYSFMCQHSLPGMITPMKSKKRVLWMTFADFSLILLSYLLLTYTGSFRFSNLDDIYTLNFFDSSATSFTLRVFLGYYLALFPVFTLSTNFPIISITLRENLKALFQTMFKKWRGDKEFPFLINRIGFPLLAISPPILIAFATTNVEALVSVTGSFPGVGVQYIIPVALAMAGKTVIQRECNKAYLNKHRSLFSRLPVFIFVCVWAGVSFVLIIVDDALKIKKGHFI